ncbi:hypothetical protein TWF481_011430 [Arthrobotrys musiformis]|uniref:Rhodanese domain-containing protein n=1 Tax=Arthrobotrys musiformis TaxID=47236 RepID=A0AAV9VZR3_9PEZI
MDSAEGFDARKAAERREALRNQLLAQAQPYNANVQQNANPNFNPNTQQLNQQLNQQNQIPNMGFPNYNYPSGTGNQYQGQYNPQNTGNQYQGQYNPQQNTGNQYQNYQGSYGQGQQTRPPVLNLIPLGQRPPREERKENEVINEEEEKSEFWYAGLPNANPSNPSYNPNMQSSIFTPGPSTTLQTPNQNTAQRLNQQLQINRNTANALPTSEEDFDFEIQDERGAGPLLDMDEKQTTQGLNPSGGRTSKVSSQPLRTSRKLSEHGLTRSLMSMGPQSYVRRSDNTIQPLRQLRYIERAQAADVGFGASMALAAWSRFGGDMGSVTAEDLYAYITRPGVRPTDYLIVDTRAEGGTTRLSNVSQAVDRVHVIPYSSNKCNFTAQEFKDLKEGIPSSTEECDMMAPEVARAIESSRARYIIVHCAQGRNRSPVIAMALHANLRRRGSNKKVLLLVGGSDTFWSFVQNPEAQRQYYQREEDERHARQRTPEQIALQREQILRDNPNVIELPGSPEIQIPQIPRIGGTLSTMPGTNAMLESTISPTWEQLTIQGARRQAGLSNLPLEEADRADTINRDAQEFLQYYKNEPTEGCKDDNCKNLDKGPDNGPSGPGGGMNGGGGGFSGGMGGGMGGGLLTKRGMDPLDIAGGRLRKRSFGLFMPEPVGKGLRIIPRR